MDAHATRLKEAPMSNIFRVSLCAVVCASLSVIGSAQTTDFSGTWEFNTKASQGLPEPVSLAGGEAPAVEANGRVSDGGFAALAAAAGFQLGTGKAVDAFRLVIKQSADEFNVLDGGVPLLFKLDGSENGISAIGRAGYPKGKAAWDGGKLVLTTKQDVYVGHAQFETRAIKYVYSMSGDTLTIDKTDTFQGKTKATKLVYTKTK
jgi:hypothetical protein